MTQIINYNNKMFFEGKFKILSETEPKIEYDFQNSDKYVKIGNNLTLKLVKIPNSKKIKNVNNIEETKKKNLNEFEIILIYDNRDSIISKEKPISNVSKPNDLSKNNEPIIMIEKSPSKKNNNEKIELLRDNLLNKKPNIEYNSSLSTSLQIPEDEFKKANSCIQNKKVIELNEEEINNEKISSKSQIVFENENVGLSEKNPEKLIKKKRKRDDEEKSFQIVIDNSTLNLGNNDFITYSEPKINKSFMNKSNIMNKQIIKNDEKKIGQKSKRGRKENWTKIQKRKKKEKLLSKSIIFYFYYIFLEITILMVNIKFK